MTHRQIFVALIPFVSTIACSNQAPVDIGRNVGSALSDYAATWDGYTEAFRFNSDSDRIRITLDNNGQGTLLVGDDPAPAPLDPDNANPTTLLTPSSLVPGLAYPIHDARVEAKRIQLSVSLYEQYRNWCAAQPPVCDAGEPCRCAHGWATSCRDGAACTQQNPDTGETISVPYNKVILCSVGSVCSCTTSGCTIDEQQYAVPLDAALENSGDDLVGTLVVGQRINVRMTRQ